jgi:hypothetical protein
MAMRTTSTRRKTTLGALFVIVAALTGLGELTGTGPLMLGGSDANAVIGRPLTPMSYAGVARRTTRRTVYAGSVARPAVVAPTAVVATTAVATTLPAGCARVMSGGVVYYQCGAARYQPYYHGSTLVYGAM